MMEATEFLKAKQTMCDTYTTCEGCPVYEAFRNGETFYNCGKAFLHQTTKTVALVENWWKEHKPKVKTNLDHVAEQLTLIGYEVNKKDLEFTCPPPFTYEYTNKKGCKNENCEDCFECRAWWNKPFEEPHKK